MKRFLNKGQVGVEENATRRKAYWIRYASNLLVIIVLGVFFTN